MNQKDISRNITLYKLFVIFNEPLFWGPIVITSLQKLGGMSLASIYYMEAAVIVLSLFVDIPAGALADLIGRKKVIVIGQVLLLASFTTFAFMSTPLMAWTGNILWALGASFQSGADVALIYDTLKEGGREGEYKQIKGSAVGTRFVLFALCCLCVGPLAEVSLRLPLLLSIPALLIPFACCFLFKESVMTKRYSAAEQLQTLKAGTSFAFRSREVMWLVGFAALIAAASKIWFFTYNPYFELVGLGIRQYGLVFFLLNIVAWLSSRYAYSIERKISEKACVLMIVPLLGIPILVMGLVPLWPMAYLVMVQNVVRGFSGPFLEDFINRHVESGTRSTVLSVRSTSTNLACVLALALFGAVTDHFGLLQSLLLLGLMVLVLGRFMFNGYRKIFE